jgi:hypothetical protein
MKWGGGWILAQWGVIRKRRGGRESRKEGREEGGRWYIPLGKILPKPTIS